MASDRSEDEAGTRSGARRDSIVWAFVPSLVVGLLLAPLFVNIEPVGGDADTLYRPIKEQLRKSLLSGTLPYWSNAFGLGVPLAAESHVAAFYPLNWLFYRVWDVSTAYRLSMWLHMVALAGATLLYARILGLERAGAALAAIVFSLCGFQAVHAVHEPFYHLMPYLPLCLVLSDGFMRTGRLGWLAGLAIAWGFQVLLGHFQIQMWTAGLVLFFGCARAGTGGGSWRRLLALVGGLAWGAAIAAVQLRLTSELTQAAGFNRPSKFMMNYLFPPAHAAQWALPALYLGRPPVAEDGYWAALATNAEEACAYVGVVPLIFACLGLFAGGGNRRAFSLWSVLGLGAFALASMPAWWPDGFRLLLQIPGLGWFRAPARYTLLTSLTLALLAGRGLGRTITPRSFSLGLCLALAIGLASLIWTVSWSAQASYRLSLGPETIPWRYAGGALAWAVGLTGILVWRAGRVGAWLPITISVVELGALFYAGPIPWGWALRMPEQSPILSRLKQEPEVGLVGGRLKNIPARVGLTTAFPGLGITPPPPNYLLESATDPEEASIAPRSRWLRRFGVTHSVWWANDPSSGEEIARFDRDFALDSILRGDPNVRAGIGWKIVRDPAAFPPAWISSQAHLARAWGELYPTLSNHDLMDTVWFLPEDRPREGDWPKSVWPESHGRVDSLTSPSPPDRIGRVISWDGSRVVVEHGAPAYVVLRRTAYPGWMCRVDNSTKRPVLRGNGGLITIPLLGSGRKTIDVWYEPNGVREATAVSVAALIAALIAITRDCLIQKSPQKRALEPAV